MKAKSPYHPNPERIPFSDQEKIILIVYILQLIGFICPLVWIAAVIINYIKKNDLQNFWLISHNRWQIRTFWYGLFWYIIGCITIIVGIGFIILFANTVWMLYRIIKGLLYLYDRKDIYIPNLSYGPP